jgi:hypothetical protein
VVELRAQGPAHDPTRGEIEHHDEIEPPLARRNVRDVCGPDAIGTRKAGFVSTVKRRLSTLGCGGLRGVAARGHAELRCALRAYARLTHEPRHAVLAARDALRVEFRVCTRGLP